MATFGPVTAEIDWWVWGTPSYFNGYHVLASLLQPTVLNGSQPNLGRPWGIFFGCYKTRHILLSDGANCTVLRAVVLTQYRRVTDGQTDGIAVASTALAKRRAVKIQQQRREKPCWVFNSTAVHPDTDPVCIATLIRRALAEVCTVPVLLVFFSFFVYVLCICRSRVKSTLIATHF